MRSNGKAWLFIIGLVFFGMILDYCMTPSALPRVVATPVKLIATATIRQPTPTKTRTVQPTTPPVLLACPTGSINVRSGPGTDNSLVGGLVSSNCVYVVGRNQDGSWVMISGEGIDGWVLTSLLNLSGNVSTLAIPNNETESWTVILTPDNPPSSLTKSSTLTPTPNISPSIPTYSDCDPSYPTVCIPPPPPDLDCPDVKPLKNFKVISPDPHGFDKDNDGIGCES